MIEMPATLAQVNYLRKLMNERVTETRDPKRAALLERVSTGQVISRAAASAGIEWLKARPYRPGVEVPQASAKQVAFLEKLLSETNEVTEKAVRAEYETRVAAKTLSPQVTSGLIDLLLNATKKPSASVALTPGLYAHAGEIYKVQLSKAGKTYAMRMVELDEPEVKKTYTKTHEFVYAAGMIFKLTAADRLTIDAVKEFCLKTGSCGICGRTLTKQASIEAGIGPVCADKYGH